MWVILPLEHSLMVTMVTGSKMIWESQFFSPLYLFIVASKSLPLTLLPLQEWPALQGYSSSQRIKCVYFIPNCNHQEGISTAHIWKKKNVWQSRRNHFWSERGTGVRTWFFPLFPTNVPSVKFPGELVLGFSLGCTKAGSLWYRWLVVLHTSISSQHPGKREHCCS